MCDRPVFFSGPRNLCPADRLGMQRRNWETGSRIGKPRGVMPERLFLFRSFRNQRRIILRPARTQMAKQEEGRIVETAKEARGAERGPSVRNVLVWSLGLVMAGFIVVYFMFFKT